jgi:IS605 OrfB family transposase
VGKVARRKWGVRQDRHPSFGMQVQPGRQVVQGQPTCPSCGEKADAKAGLTCASCGAVKPSYVVLPPMLELGPVKVWDDLDKMRGRPVMATIREEAGHFYISLSCKIEIQPPKPAGAVIGVDLGVNSIVTLWSREALDVQRLERRLTGLTSAQEILLADEEGAASRDERIRELQRAGVLAIGEKEELSLLMAERRHRQVVARTKESVAESLQVIKEDEGYLVELTPPLPLHRKQKRLARLQRALKRKTRGSKRMARAELQITRLHEAVRWQRADYLHKLSRWLTEEGRIVVMEGFDVRKLIQHGVPKHMKGKRKRDRRRKIADIAWGDLRFRTEYKGVEHGAEFVQCDTYKATDKPCYICGTLNEIPPTTSAYHCEGCGNQTTRQRNTARLLESFGRGNSPESTPGHGETDDVDPTALAPSSAGDDPAGVKRNGSSPSPRRKAGGSAPKRHRPGKRQRQSKRKAAASAAAG